MNESHFEIHAYLSCCDSIMRSVSSLQSQRFSVSCTIWSIISLNMMLVSISWLSQSLSWNVCKKKSKKSSISLKKTWDSDIKIWRNLHYKSSIIYQTIMKSVILKQSAVFLIYLTTICFSQHFKILIFDIFRTDSRALFRLN